MQPFLSPGARFAKLKLLVMATLTIKRTAQREFSIKRYLNSKSEFFSMLMSESISRIFVIRLHLVLISFLLSAIMADTNMAVTAMSAAVGIAVASRLKQEGGRL